ncbi:MAG: PAS domain S-box protein [Treponema sp.]|jgi:PAS domain S-box-containing protein|nr:PAS domain S-box protein [Treponema sp.]
MNPIQRLEYFIGRLLTRLGFGMKAKLIIIFVIIKVIPLIILTILAWKQARDLGTKLGRRNEELMGRAADALTATGAMAVEDSVNALNNLTIEQLERTSTDMARRVADFLYARDDDILYVSELPVNENTYRLFVGNKEKPLVKKREWILSENQEYWIPKEALPEGNYSPSSNAENDTNYRNRPPDLYETELRPLYLEMTYIDLEGNEVIKVTTSDRMDPRKKNVSNRLNTYVKAETYFEELKLLKPGEIYVSDVIGAYVRSRLIGMYNPENVEKRGLSWQPEEEAYAGRENPNGKRFKGIVRWATPVLQDGRITGYVTLALDHDFIMEFTDHTTPMPERYVELPSAYEGNYAFIWDYKCRSICHPRHHSIVGFNPDTGEPEIPWLEESIYRDWQDSGLPLRDFLKDVPVFHEQSRDKKPAAELTAAGLVGLDGRYLNNAPQCIGWMDLTREGGSGSFLILWSGIWKPNTAATIPYYTGNYGKTKRGFGFVAIGAGLEDFQQPARETEKLLQEAIDLANTDLRQSAFETQRMISANLRDTSIKLLISALLMILFVVLVAIWMANIFTSSITGLINGINRFRSGERHFRFRAPIKDEIGTLADSFDDMADSLVESDRWPLIITDFSQLIKYANDAALAALGLTLEETIGKNYQDISIYPSGSLFDPILALHEGREADIFYQRESGRYLKGNASYLTDHSGWKIGYIITTSDITDIILEQKKIAEQRSLLDKIFSASPDLIWYQDRAGKILAANPRTASLSAFRVEELIGRDVKEIFPGDMIWDHEEFDAEVYAGGKPVYTERAIVFHDGHKETLDMVFTPLYEDNNNPVGILAFARDVSVRVQVEQELRNTQTQLTRAVDEANQANAHKGAFLARMSHEIRTPMNSIIGMTSIVRKKLSQPDVKLDEIEANINQIEASSQHLMGLLNDILDISKIEAGKIELSDESMDLSKLAGTVVSIIRPRCEEKNIKFETRFELPRDRAFRGDSLRLRQVLINLLGNAVKFTSETGSIFFEVMYRGNNGGERGTVDFCIRDTGIGIAEEALSSLFKPFEQASNQISKKYGGTGLGLAISRSIVKLFGGDIVVKSKSGEGSEFSFSLSLKETAPEAETEISVENAENILRGKRALLVDDVEINRVIAVNMLEFTGLELEEAGDGDDALKIFGDSEPGYFDIIYMDVQMPVMDGHEAARAIRLMERPDAQSIPIVALSANAFREDIDKAIASGMNAHLAKPLDMTKLLEVTLKALKK